MNRALVAFCFSCIVGLGGAKVEAQTITRSSDTGARHDDPVARFKAKAPKPIKHEASVGIRLNTDGWSAYVDFGKMKTQDVKHIDMYHNVRLLQVEFTEKKSPSEYKSVSTSGTGNNSYIYGKINNFYAVKLGWGFEKMLAGKPDPGTVSIHWLNAGGIAIGLLKPYYLNVWSDPSSISYKSAQQGDFLNQYLIEGSAGFSKGIDQISIIPGAHFKSAIHFDFSANRKNVIGAEAGVDAEYYAQAVQLMANQAGKPFFFDLYIAAQFGRRW